MASSTSSFPKTVKFRLDHGLINHNSLRILEEFSDSEEEVEEEVLVSQSSEVTRTESSHEATTKEEYKLSFTPKEESNLIFTPKRDPFIKHESVSPVISSRQTPTRTEFKKTVLSDTCSVKKGYGSPIKSAKRELDHDLHYSLSEATHVKKRDHVATYPPHRHRHYSPYKFSNSDSHSSHSPGSNSSGSFERKRSTPGLHEEEFKSQLPTPAREMISPLRQSPPAPKRRCIGNNTSKTSEYIPASEAQQQNKTIPFTHNAYLVSQKSNHQPSSVDDYKQFPMNNHEPVDDSEQPPMYINQRNKKESPSVDRNEPQVNRNKPITNGNHTRPPSFNTDHEFKPPAPIQQNDSFPVPEDSNLQVIPRPGETIKVNGKAYMILKLLGEGASGKVFLVHSSKHQDLFALKWIPLKTPEDKEPIDAEISMLLLLKEESSIISLYDYYSTPNVVYMVMEQGEVSFQQLIANNAFKDWDISFIKYYWLQMLRAVHVIHKCCVVHSDLKPANFVVVKGCLKLIDFGIAKKVSDDTTHIHRDVAVGTVNYMAPEALADASEGEGEPRQTKHGRPSDVWSLGCILYQMVYGRPPFYHFPIHLRVNKILDQKYQIKFDRKTIHNKQEIAVPKALLKILEKCLDRTPEFRPPMFELLSDPFVNN